MLSYSLLFSNFRWFVLAAQSGRALDVSPLDSQHRGMCCLSRSRSMTLLRRMNLLRLWSQYRQGKTHKKLNRCRRTMIMTSKRKKTMGMKKKRATRLKVKMMKNILLGATLRRTRRSMTPTRSKLLEMKPRSPLADFIFSCLMT
jgi:hypothetical protein